MKSINKTKSMGLLSVFVFLGLLAAVATLPGVSAIHSGLGNISLDLNVNLDLIDFFDNFDLNLNDRFDFFDNFDFDNNFGLGNDRFDSDNDGDIDENDILNLSDTLGVEIKGDLDFNNDGEVNEKDLNILLDTLDSLGVGVNNFGLFGGGFGFLDNEPIDIEIEIDSDEGLFFRESRVIRNNGFGGGFFGRSHFGGFF